VALIDAAEEAGLIRADTIILEPTSGNNWHRAGAGSRGARLPLVLTMPETMSIDGGSYCSPRCRTRPDSGRGGHAGAIARPRNWPRPTNGTSCPNSSKTRQSGNPPQNHRGGLARHRREDRHLRGRGRHRRHHHRGCPGHPRNASPRCSSWPWSRPRPRCCPAARRDPTRSRHRRRVRPAGARPRSARRDHRRRQRRRGQLVSTAGREKDCWSASPRRGHVPRCRSPGGPRTPASLLSSSCPTSASRYLSTRCSPTHRTSHADGHPEDIRAAKQPGSGRPHTLQVVFAYPGVHAIWATGSATGSEPGARLAGRVSQNSPAS